MRKISQTTGLKQSQSVMMTPQMQLAMRVLSLGQLELSDLIQEKIEENPMLEHLDEEASRADETSPEISLQDAPEAEPSTDIAESEAWADDHNIDRAIEERDFNVLHDSASPMTVSYENFATTELTRAEALQDQLRDILSDAAVRSVAFDLVYWLDEDGIFARAILRLLRACRSTLPKLPMQGRGYKRACRVG